MTERLLNNFDERFKEVERNLSVIKENINEAAYKSGRKPEEITLLAATKTVPVEIINYSISLGINCIGENRVQEFLSKYDSLNLENCRADFIGHLQTNKVKDIIGKVEMIHSVDSLRLANQISKVSSEKNVITKILVEVNIGEEKTKSGVLLENLEDFIFQISKINAIKVSGLMIIPPNCRKKSEKLEYFSQIRKKFLDIRNRKLDNVDMRYLSMGMSSDYAEAIAEGSNIVRVGSALFGNRDKV